MARWELRCTLCGKLYNFGANNADERDFWLKHLICNEPCQSPLEVVPSAPNFVLKGSGWTEKGNK